MTTIYNVHVWLCNIAEMGEGGREGGGGEKELEDTVNSGSNLDKMTVQLDTSTHIILYSGSYSVHYREVSFLRRL